MQHLGGEAGVHAGPGRVFMCLRISDFERGEHRVQTFGPESGRRQLERNARLDDLALGAHQPLRQSRLLNQEGAGDLGHRKSANEAQSERRPRVGRHGGVAANED